MGGRERGKEDGYYVAASFRTLPLPSRSFPSSLSFPSPFLVPSFRSLRQLSPPFTCFSLSLLPFPPLFLSFSLFSSFPFHRQLPPPCFPCRLSRPPSLHHRPVIPPLRLHLHTTTPLPSCSRCRFGCYCCGDCSRCGRARERAGPCPVPADG